MRFIPVTLRLGMIRRARIGHDRWCKHERAVSGSLAAEFAALSANVTYANGDERGWRQPSADAYRSLRRSRGSRSHR